MLWRSLVFKRFGNGLQKRRFSSESGNELGPEDFKRYRMIGETIIFTTMTTAFLVVLAISASDSALGYCQEYYPTVARVAGEFRAGGKLIRKSIEKGFYFEEPKPEPFNLEDLTEFMKTHPFWDEWEGSKKQ